MEIQPSVLSTLRTVEFRLGLKGYNVDEVDEYLEKAAVEADTLNERIRHVADRLRAANERISQLEAQIENGPQPVVVTESNDSVDESLKRTLVLAQRFVDQTRAESEAEAAARIAHAEERARAMIAEAEARAVQVSNDAAVRLQNEVARLEEMRTQLSGEVSAMSRHLEAEQARLRSSLSEVLAWVEQGLTSTAAYTPTSTPTESQMAPVPPQRPQSPQSPPERRSVPLPQERPAVVNGARLRSVPPAPSADLFDDSTN
jgi:cell division initiation protein